MIADDDHWPSLPPIRTSSYNARVSCETLNLHISPPAAAPAHAHTVSTTPPSVSQWAKAASKSADASPRCSQSTSPSQVFSSCFGRKFSKGHRPDRRRGGAQGHGGAFDASGLLRSIFGFSTPMVSFTSGASPSNWQSPQSSWQTPPSLTSSPSGRTSPIPSLRPGAATSHSGTLLRSSKGHSGHVHAFSLVPPEVVGKKKSPGYESDEPTSPEVTCIGKVRRKHCKATWDAVVKEKHKDAKKKRKGKQTQPKSEAHRSLDFGGMPTDFETHTPAYNDLTKEDETHSSQACMESSLGDAHTHRIDCAGCDLPSCPALQSGLLETRLDLQGKSVVGADPGDSDASTYGKKTGSDASSVVSEVLPPPDCLILMKKGSRNRSARHCADEQALHEPRMKPWNFGQVLT